MTFEEAFRKVSEVKEIEPVPNCSYLYEIEGEGIKTEEQVIEYAQELFGSDVEPAQPESPKEQQEPRKYRLIPTDKEQTQLTKIRQDRNLTQKELAQKSGVSIQAIRNYEQGVKPIESVQYSILKKLAGALECSVEDIVGKG